jgi:hypothetical protein
MGPARGAALVAAITTLMLMTRMLGTRRMPVVTLGRVRVAAWVAGWAVDLEVALGADQVGGSAVA